MDWFAGYVYTYLIEGFIAWQYFSNMFISKTKKHIECLCYVVGYATLLFASNLQSIFINLGGFFIVNMAILLICYKVNIVGAFFHPLILTVVMGCGEWLGLGVLGIVIPEYNAIPRTKADFLMHGLIGKFIYLLISRIIVVIWGKKKKFYKLSNRSLVLVTIIPLLSIYIMMSFFVISIKYSVQNDLDWMFIASALIMLIINLMTFWMYTHNEKMHNKFMEMQMLRQKEKDDVEYYKMLVDQDEKQKILMHDIKGHLYSIKLLNEEGNSSKISEYIDGLNISSKLYNNRNVSSNPLLNSIINRYTKLCEEKEIQMDVSIRDKGVDFLTDEEITAVFCNLLENAVEAAQKVKDSMIDMNVSCNEAGTISLISMCNSCISKPLYDEEGRLITSKEDKLLHGFGMRSIQRIVDKYGGNMKHYYDEVDSTYNIVIIMNKSM